MTSLQTRLADLVAEIGGDIKTLQDGVAAASGSSNAVPFTQNIGDGSSTSFTITHNFGTKSVNVVCYRNVSPYDEVEVDVEHTTADTVTVKTAPTVPSASEYKIVVSSTQGPGYGTTVMDSWHTIGGAGEPAFTNSWTNYGAPYKTAAFRKFPNGKVKLTGLIKTGALNTTIFTLPVGYRPTATIAFACFASGGVAQVQIDTAGAVVPVTGTSGTVVSTALYLDGVEFDTESVTSIPTGPAGPPGADGAPLGAVIPWTRTTIPAGYVLADGATYSQASYPDGYAVAVAEVAAGNTAWTTLTSPNRFTVPDLTDRFLLGKGATYPTMYAKSGAATHTLTTAELPPHSHPVDYNNAAASGSAVPSPANANGGGATLNTRNTGSGTAHNNMPPYVVLAFIVKVMPGANEVGAKEVVSTPTLSAATYSSVGPGASGANVPATAASITLTPGRWMVRARVNVSTGTADGVSCGLYNQTSGAYISNSAGPAGTCGTAGYSTHVSTEREITVASNTQICPLGMRHGSSALTINGNVASGPAADITAIYLGSGGGSTQDRVMRVDTLPSSPSDGDEVYYQSAAMLSAGVPAWHLKYNLAMSGSYKWEVLSAKGLTSEQQNYDAGNSDSVTSTSFVSMPSNSGPAITVPLAGDYDIEIMAQLQGNAVLSYSIGAATAADGDGILNAASGSNGNPYRKRRKTGIAASSAITAKQRSLDGSAGVTLRRAMFVTPIRVG